MFRRKHDIAPPEAIAEWFLCFTAEHGDVLTHLKLQKLVYYAQAWYLALEGKPLFREDFQAWVHGPVLPSLYRKYRRNDWRPLAPPSKCPALPQKVLDHLEEVFAEYGDFSAFSLERMTHAEQPWQAARDGLAPDEPGRRPISKEDMREFYRRQVA